MEPVANLGMYDLEELRADQSRLWRAVAAHLTDLGWTGVPDKLLVDVEPASLWLHPGLILAQTCGLPFATSLGRRVRYVATPVYRAEGCQGPAYRSLIVARGDLAVKADQVPTGVVAVNDKESRSGRQALTQLLGCPLEAHFTHVLMTGSHLNSLTALRVGRANVAAIDCVLWALLARHRPSAIAGVTPIGWSLPAPGLPLITAASRSDREVEDLVSALKEAVRSPALSRTCERLLIEDLIKLPADAYQVLAALG
ncbi:MAG: phosphate/phosphite/phosphonate ABC transporter substrate-binding protein [Geminicoccaceae bacterium]